MIWEDICDNTKFSMDLGRAVALINGSGSSQYKTPNSIQDAAKLLLKDDSLEASVLMVDLLSLFKFELCGKKVITLHPAFDALLSLYGVESLEGPEENMEHCIYVNKPYTFNTGHKVEGAFVDANPTLTSHDRDMSHKDMVKRHMDTLGNVCRVLLVLQGSSSSIPSRFLLACDAPLKFSYVPEMGYGHKRFTALRRFISSNIMFHFHHDEMNVHVDNRDERKHRDVLYEFIHYIIEVMMTAWMYHHVINDTFGEEGTQADFQIGTNVPATVDIFSIAFPAEVEEVARKNKEKEIYGLQGYRKLAKPRRKTTRMTLGRIQGETALASMYGMPAFPQYLPKNVQGGGERG